MTTFSLFNLPWDEVLGNVEDLIAGLAGLVSALKSRV